MNELLKIDNYELLCRNNIKIACVNFHSFWGRKDLNLDKIKVFIKIAAKNKADIIVFPEMALTGYDIEDIPKMHKENAEKIPGESTFEISKIAKKYKIYVIFGMPQKIIEKSIQIYNACAVIGPKGIIGSYLKLMPSINELRYCKKGKLPFYFNTPWGIIGLGICYDTYMFPEVARFYAALGARLYINVTALASFPGWKKYYLNQLKARTIENMIFIVSSNLVGKEKKLNFVGNSIILGPGETYHKVKIFSGPASQKNEEIIYANINLDSTDKAKKSFPLFTENPSSGSPDWRLKLNMQMLKEINKNTKLGSYE